VRPDRAKKVTGKWAGQTKRLDKIGGREPNRQAYERAIGKERSEQKNPRHPLDSGDFAQLKNQSGEKKKINPEKNGAPKKLFEQFSLLRQYNSLMAQI
jgi:hypothetical protein